MLTSEIFCTKKLINNEQNLELVKYSQANLKLSAKSCDTPIVNSRIH